MRTHNRGGKLPHLKVLLAERAAVGWIRSKIKDHKSSFRLLAEAIVGGATITDPLPKGTTVIIRERLEHLLKNDLFNKVIDDEKIEELPKILKLSQMEKK